MEKQKDSGKPANLTPERCQNLVETTADWLWEVDEKTRYQYSSPQVKEIIGYRPQEVFGKSIFDFMDVNERKRCQKIFAEISAKKEGLRNFEHTNISKNGKLVHLETNCNPFFDNSGNLKGFRGINRSITKRKEIEESLKKSEEKFRSLFETLTQGVVYHDSEGKIITANKAAADILGLTMDQLLGRTSMDPRWRAIHEDGSDFPGETHPAIIALRECKPVKNTIMGVYHPKRSRYCWININATPQFRKSEKKPCHVYAIFEDITEQKHAQDALRESEERFRKVFEEGPLGIVLLDKNNRFITMNNAFSKMIGYSEKELEKKSFEAVTYPEDIDISKRKAKELFDQKVPAVQFEKRYIRKDGKVIWVNLASSLLKDEKGNILYALSMFEDITERKKAEEELKFRSFLLDSATDSILVHDLNGNMLYVNEAAYKERGYTKKELLKTNLKQIDTPEYTKKQKERMQNLLKDRTAVFDTEHLRKDGTIIKVEVHARVFEGAERTLIASVVRDITKRKEYEEALRESEKRYRTLAEAAHDAIFIINKKDEFEYINKFAAALFGKKPEDVIGKKRKNFFPAEISKKQSEDLKQVFETGQPLYAEDLTQFPQGQIWLGTWVVPIKDNKGNVEAVMGVSRDISGLKEAQEELEAAYETEHRIADTLQKSLLPDLPKIKDLEVKTFYQSASKDAEVGGDFYDFFRVSSGEYCFVVGDVAGKGIDAATETAKIKYLLRDRAYYENNAARVISKVNNALFKQKTGRFTTLTIAMYNMDTNRLSISNAGNPFAYLAAKDRFLELTGVPVGIMPKQSYPETTVQLGKGEVIVIFTDGLVEPRKKSELFGSERVRLYLKKNKDLSLNAMIKGLVKKARDFSGDNLTDDMLIMAIRRK